MIVYSRDLPTRGYLSKIDQFKLNPMNFGEILKYLGDMELTKLRDYIKDLQYLIERDPKIADVNLLDAEYILFLFKLITINKELKFKINVPCKECDKEYHSISVSSADLSFKDIPNEYMSIQTVELGGETILFKYPTIAEFIEFVAELPRYIEDIRIDVIKLASMLDIHPQIALKKIMEAEGEDITMINVLDNMLFDSVQPIQTICPVTKRGITAPVPLSAVDIFRSILESNPIATTKIQFRQISKDRESE